MTKLRSTRRWLVVLTITAVPLALAVESALRYLLLPPEFEEVRFWLEPTMTTASWGLLGVSVLVGAAGALGQSRWARAAVRRRGPNAEPEAAERACIGVFIITASLAQGPALLASFAFLLGSALLPVLCAVALSTLMVTVQALRIDAGRAGLASTAARGSSVDAAGR